jgi:hypothetical protein
VVSILQSRIGLESDAHAGCFRLARGSESLVARRDLYWTVAAGGTSLAVYVRTLAPGVVAELDTPMFQFVGRVLGVAHNPGYPLYVLLTYPIALLPIGSLPYRINLFSALWGALTVALVFLVARRLGCGRAMSLVAALGLGFGQVFWSQAVIAEVYTMHAALVAGVLLGMLEWGRSRRSWCFYAGVAALAAGLAHHTTIVALVPAIAAYGWLTDRRFVLRLRTLMATAAILAAGLLPYGFIVLRSNQPGAYLESKATSVAQLPNVILARQFRDRIFAFDWWTVMTDRLPGIATGVLASELTIPGLALAIVGAAMLLRRRLADALLLLIGAAAVFAFALNYSVVDTPVFLIPTLLVLWLLAAVGAEHLAGLARGRLAPRAAVLLTALMLPAWLLAHNFEASDRSRDTGSSVFLDRLFEAFPSRTALVHEDFLVDRLIRFKLLADAAARGRSIELVNRGQIRRQQDAGAAVFAFAKSARRVRLDGFPVSFEPLTLSTLSLAELTASVAAGSVVALAAPASLAAQFAASTGASVREIGGPATLTRTAQSSIAVVGVRGARSGAIVKADALNLELAIGPGAFIGDTGRASPAEISIRAGATDVSIRQDSRDLVRTSEGAVLAIWRPDGRLTHAVVLQAVEGFRASLPAGPLSAYPVRRASAQEVGADWTDVTPTVAFGGFVIRVPAGQALVMQVSDDGLLQPRVVDRTPETEVQITRAADQALDLYRHTYWINVRASGAEPASVLIALGGVPRRALGRVVTAGPGVALVPVDYQGLLRTPDRVTEVLLLSRDEQSQLVGAGWSRVDSQDAYRWMTAAEARVLLPVARAGVRRVRLQALREASGPTSIRLALNGAALPWQELRLGWHSYEWELPPDLVTTGPTEAAVLVDALPRQRGNEPLKAVAIADIRLIAR